MDGPEKKDKRVLLEKGNGLGWTLNFDNKWSYVILVIIILFIAFVFIYGFYYQH